MIVGNGDIASVLPDRPEFTFFASGISNSQYFTDEDQRREVDLLLKSQSDFKRLVYFSSLSVFYSHSPYAQHKKSMERTVRNFPQYTIIRIGNIDWGNNPSTLINFMRGQVKNGDLVKMHDAYRYIVDKEEFLHWINLIPSWNCEINIPGKRMKVADIFDTYVRNYGNA